MRISLSRQTGGHNVRTDELYVKLKNLHFIDNYYISHKGPDSKGEGHGVLKIYDDDAKLAEVSIDQPYMLRTTYEGFAQRNLLEQQALLNLLVAYASTPVDQRRSELYFAYYNDLNNIPHFIKRLSNNRLTDDMIPMAYFNTLSPQEREKYLFSAAELAEFPADYQPRFRPDSFVKVKPLEEFEAELSERFTEETEE